MSPEVPLTVSLPFFLLNLKDPTLAGLGYLGPHNDNASQSPVTSQGVALLLLIPYHFPRRQSRGKVDDQPSSIKYPGQLVPRSPRSLVLYRPICESQVS